MTDSDDDDGLELNIFVKPKQIPSKVVPQPLPTPPPTQQQKQPEQNIRDTNNNNSNQQQSRDNNNNTTTNNNNNRVNTPTNQAANKYIPPWKKNHPQSTIAPEDRYHRYAIKNDTDNSSSSSSSSTSSTTNNQTFYNNQKQRSKYRDVERGRDRNDTNYKPSLPKMEPSKSKIDDMMQVFSTSQFGDLSLSSKITENLAQHMNISQPTLIQSKSIPPILEGNDVMVKAQTGSGKTLAYLIPIVQILSNFKVRITRQQGAYAIVVAPTRELAIQINQVLVQLLKPFHWIIPGCIMGGEDRDKEKRLLRKGANIIVATPGRMLDHLIKTQSFKTDMTRWLVLDEADRLLDLGFEKSISSIIDHLNQSRSKSFPIRRQNVLVSATLSEDIARLASLSLSNPIYVGSDSTLQIDTSNNNNNDDNEQDEDGYNNNNKKIGGGKIDFSQLLAGEGLEAPKQLDQYFVEVEAKERLVSLISFIKWKTTLSQISAGNSKMIVFFSSCASVDFHHYLFTKSHLENQQQKTAQSSSLLQTTAEEDEKIDKTPLFSTTIFKLHGEIDQKQRTDTFFKFQKAKKGILLTTDVAARGLDLPQVNWIVQYDPCSDTKDYVHRIGRTARLGHTGSALIFLLPSERKYVHHLAKHGIEPMELKVITILQSLYHSAEGQLKKTKRSTQLESQVHDLQLNMERFIVDDEGARDLARVAYQSSLRAYSTHRAELKYIFHIGSLHLGHMSKSFALRETPTELNKITAKQEKKAKKEEDIQKSKKTVDYKMRNYKQTDEFGNGIAIMPIQLKKKRSNDDIDNDNDEQVDDDNDDDDKQQSTPSQTKLLLPVLSSKSNNNNNNIVKRVKRDQGF